MRYLRRFDESSYIKDVAEECEDILIAIRDDQMSTTVESKTSVRYGTQTIEIFIDPRQGEGSMIDLSGQAETLERLIYYLESEGFRLAAGRYESTHSHDVCPNCGSEDRGIHIEDGRRADTVGREEDAGSEGFLRVDLIYTL